MKKKKILIALLIIILILLIIVAIRWRIFYSINEKYDISNKSNNYYYQSTSKDTILTYWKKENINKLNCKQVNGEGNLTFWEDEKTGESFVFIEVNKTYSRHNGFTVKSMPAIGFYVSPEERAKITFLFAINPFITLYSGTYEGKQCYIWGYSEAGNGTKEWIEKDTGLVVYQETTKGEFSRKVEYSMNTVTDEDIKMPNIAEYTLK